MTAVTDGPAALFPAPAREWCPCGAGLFIMMRGMDGERYFECGACERRPAGE